jgi:hypothetical protein
VLSICTAGFNNRYLCILPAECIHGFHEIHRKTAIISFSALTSKKLHPKRQREPRQTSEETSGCVRPERINRLLGSYTMECDKYVCMCACVCVCVCVCMYVCMYVCMRVCMMMEAVRTSETLVDNHFTRQYIPEGPPLWSSG